MIKYCLSLVLAMFTVAALAAGPGIDIEKSTVKWTGEKVTGSHTGTVNIKEGNLEISNGVLAGGSFVIDMTSITNSDMDGEMKGKLEGHLKSADFFGVEAHPTASLQITNVQPRGPGSYKVVADLTIKGITKPVKFNVDMGEADGMSTASATIVVDRSEYDVRYGSGAFFDDLKDKTIYDEFTLDVNLVMGKIDG